MPEPTLNDLSLRVGGLTAKIEILEQAVSRLVDSQTRVVDTFTAQSVDARQFEEYRKTQHVQWNNAHIHLSSLEHKQEKLEERLERLSREQNARMDRIDHDLATRAEAIGMKTENLLQSLTIKSDQRFSAIEHLMSEWKGGVRTTSTIMFFIASLLGSGLGYVVEAFVIKSVH